MRKWPEAFGKALLLFLVLRLQMCRMTQVLTHFHGLWAEW